MEVTELRVEVPDEIAERPTSEAAEKGTSTEDVAAEVIGSADLSAGTPGRAS